MAALKSVEHRVKRIVFLLLGQFLLRKGNDLHSLEGKSLRKVLFLRHDKIGDMVISLPVFYNLKKAFPHIEISVVGSPVNYEIIKYDRRFKNIHIYRKHIWHDLRMLFQIRRERYDCVIDMISDDSVTALFMSQLFAPGKPRIGVGKVRYRDYYDFNYPYRLEEAPHVLDNTLMLLKPFGISRESVSPYVAPFLPADSESQASAYVNSLRNGNPQLLVGYNLSAGSPTRLWQKENSVRFLQSVLEKYPRVKFVLLTIPKERSRAEEIAGLIGEDRVQVAPDKMTLIQVSSLIKRLNMLVSPDTSLVHIARSFQVPVLGLYTSFVKNLLLWRPYGQDVGVVVSVHQDNIHDITVEQVVEAFDQLVKTELKVTK